MVRSGLRAPKSLSGLIRAEKNTGKVIVGAFKLVWQEFAWREGEELGTQGSSEFIYHWMGAELVSQA